MLFELALFCLFLFLLALWNSRAPPGVPPGPKRYPIIGSKKILKSPEDYENLRDEFGDIVWTKMGAFETVTVFDFKLAREAYSKAELTTRPDWKAIQYLEEGETGIIFSNGEEWSTTRRFLLRTLRDLGMGKSRLSDAILEEVKVLVEDFKSYTKSPTELPSSINLSVLNVIWQLVASRRYDLKDERILRFMKLTREYQTNLQFLILPDLFPWLNYLPKKIKGKLFKIDWLKEISVEARGFMREAINDCKKDLDRENPRNVIDAYLIEIEENKVSHSLFNENALMRNIFDLFAAGFDTTSNTIRWMCLYLAAYPDIQRRIHEEIDEIVGSEVLPSLVHRPRLVHLEAFVLEVLRLRPVAAAGVPHMASEDISLGGYRIPKGCMVNVCISAIQTDPRIWDRPKEFNPDRFIDENGDIAITKEGFFPFSVGRRSCLGESLARMELFLFTAGLAQNFTFAPPEGCEIDLGCLPIPGHIFSKPQDVVITSRK